MKIRQHHKDLLGNEDPVFVDMHLRTMIQLEMIEDHSYLTGKPIHEAAMDWVESEWAKLFSEKYILKRD
jgi:hypothetical protein